LPVNPYIISKHSVENYVQFYAKVYNLDFVIFRYAPTYGPRQITGAMHDYIRSIYKNKQAEIYGDGKKTRDYVFIDDITKANLMALDYKPQKDVIPLFNLSTNKQTSLYVLYKKIAILLTKPEAEPKFMPDRAGEIIKLQLDNTKAKKYLGWKPKIDLDLGLKKTVNFFLQNQK
jgi:UDP-glucose 4-epimerase